MCRGSQTSDMSHVKESALCNVWLSFSDSFRVQIPVCSAEWGSHISIFHSQLHHHTYEEQQTSRKQCECSQPVHINVLLTQNIFSALVGLILYSILLYLCSGCRKVFPAEIKTASAAKKRRHALLCKGKMEMSHCGQERVLRKIRRILTVSQTMSVFLSM